MSKDKEVKTNAMRILDRNKVKYKVNTYECDEFIDGIHIADMLGQPYESSFKTLVTVGKSGNYYVFARSWENVRFPGSPNAGSCFRPTHDDTVLSWHHRYVYGRDGTVSPPRQSIPVY